MVHINIDEITIVILTDDTFKNSNAWRLYAMETVHHIEKILNIESLFGRGHWTSERNPQGYTRGKSYENLLPYFRIAYHDYISNMGVIVKFSAQALCEYQQRYLDTYGDEIHCFQILQLLNSFGYHARLSRIDIAADYINEGLSVDTIYKELKEKNTVIRFSNGKRNPSTIHAVENDGTVETFYVGKRGKNAKALLRVYDKKTEQLEKNRYSKLAQTCKNWVRFEGEFKTQYAHDISDYLQQIRTYEEQCSFLAKALTDKYSFYLLRDRKNTEYTQHLLEIANGTSEFSFSRIDTRNHDLFSTYNYLISGSGLLSFLYKVNAIWGRSGIEDVLRCFEKELDSYTVTEDIHYWINKNAPEYIRMSRENVPFLCADEEITKAEKLF